MADKSSFPVNWQGDIYYRKHSITQNLRQRHEIIWFTNTPLSIRGWSLDTQLATMKSPISINSDDSSQELSKPEQTSPKEDAEISKEVENKSMAKKHRVIFISLM